MTSLGSLSSLVIVFTQINNHFKITWALPAALALRTVFSVLSGNFLKNHLYRYSTRWLLFFAESIGILSIVFLYIGFDSKRIILILIGISVAAIPSNFFNVGLSYYLKTLKINNEEYIKLSGFKEVIFGVVFILSAALAPLLYSISSIYTIFLFDLGTYILSIIILISYKPFSLNGGETTENNPINISLFSIEKIKFASSNYLLMISSLLTISILPLVAGDHILSKQYVSSLKHYFWVAEGLPILIGGLIYSRLYNIISSNFMIKYSLGINATILLLISIGSSIFSLFITLTILSLIIHITFMILRDDLLLTCRNSKEVSYFSATSSIIRSIMCTLSPFVISYIFVENTALTAIYTIIAIQLFLVSASFYLSRHSNI